MTEILPTESHERASHKIVKKNKIVHIKKEDKPGLSAMDKREILATVSKAQLRKKQNMVNMKNEIVKEINNAKEILQNQDKHISQHIAATTLPSNHSELQNEKKTLMHSIKTILQANSTYLQDASLTTPLLAVQNVLGITQSSPVQKYTKSNNIFNITEKSKGITPTSNLKEAEHKTEVWKKDTHTFDAFTETPYNIVSTIPPMQSPANNIHARLHEDDGQVIHPPPDMSAKKNIQINIQREYTNKIMNHTSPPFMPAHSPKLLKTNMVLTEHNNKTGNTTFEINSLLVKKMDKSKLTNKTLTYTQTILLNGNGNWSSENEQDVHIKDGEHSLYPNTNNHGGAPLNAKVQVKVHRMTSNTLLIARYSCIVILYHFPLRNTHVKNGF